MTALAPTVKVRVALGAAFTGAGIDHIVKSLSWEKTPTATRAQRGTAELALREFGVLRRRLLLEHREQHGGVLADRRDRGADPDLPRHLRKRWSEAR